MDIKRLKERKKLMGYTNKEVANLSGVPLGTVQKIFGSSTKEPRRETVVALAKVLDPEMANRLQITYAPVAIGELSSTKDMITDAVPPTVATTTEMFNNCCHRS